MSVRGQKLRGAIIVTRVSTPNQANEGTSLEGQLEACRRKAAIMGLPVIAEYEEPGISGVYLVLREGMQGAIRDIQAGRADTLITFSMSRYSRDEQAGQLIKKAVEAAGGRVVFTDMEFEQTPEGDLAFSLFGGFAAYERKVFIARSTAGRRRRANDGIQTARSYPPYGYHIVTKQDVLVGRFAADRLGRYEVIADEACWVVEMFTRYADGQSLRAICRFLESEHVPTPRNGEYWRPSTLKRIMDNPTYYGKAPYARHKNIYDETRRERGLKLIVYKELRSPEDWILIECPALVSPEVWDSCQRRLLDGKSQFGGNPQHRHMLSGLLRCPVCKRGMGGVKRDRLSRGKPKHEHYYHCLHSRPSRNTGGVVCNPKQYDGHQAEQIITQAIQRIVADPHLVATALATYRNDLSADVDPHAIAQAKTALRTIENKEKAAAHAQVDAIAKGRNPSLYDSILDDCTAERKIVMARLEQLDRAKQIVDQIPSDAALLSQMVADVTAALSAAELTSGEKHDLLARIIAEILPEGDGYKIAMKPFPTHPHTSGTPPGPHGARQAASPNGPATVANMIAL